MFFLLETGLMSLETTLAVSVEGRVMVTLLNLGGSEDQVLPGTLCDYVSAGDSSSSMVLCGELGKTHPSDHDYGPICQEIDS